MELLLYTQCRGPRDFRSVRSPPGLAPRLGQWKETSVLICYAHRYGNLSANNRRLTLAQIYQWISVNFSYYSMAEGYWQNSIRHSLGLHKNFVRIERSKHGQGKGHYWGIRHGQEHLFVPEERHRRHRAPATDMSSGNLQSIHGSTDCSSPEGGVSTASNTEQASKAPDLRNNMRQDCPDNTTHSPHGTNAPALFDKEEDLQQGAFSHAPPTTSIKSRLPRKHDSSLSSPGPRSHREGAPSGAKANVAVDNRRHILLDNTPIAHVDPAQLTLQAGIGRSHPRLDRAGTEIARMRKSHGKVRTKYKRITDFRVTPLNPSLRRRDFTLGNSSNPSKYENPSENSPSLSPDWNLRNHRNNVRALLGSSSDPRSPSDQRLTLPSHFSSKPVGFVSL
ncbi:hypothetical protein Q7P37_003036 [Cladosporium fusiforme]